MIMTKKERLVELEHKIAELQEERNTLILESAREEGVSKFTIALLEQVFAPIGEWFGQKVSDMPIETRFQLAAKVGIMIKPGHPQYDSFVDFLKRVPRSIIEMARLTSFVAIYGVGSDMEVAHAQSEPKL